MKKEANRNDEPARKLQIENSGTTMAKFGCLQAPSKMYLHLKTSFFSPKLREQGKYFTFKTSWKIHFLFPLQNSIQMLSHLLYMLSVDMNIVQ